MEQNVCICHIPNYYPSEIVLSIDNERKLRSK